MSGLRLGPYRLVRKLATGGMAEIFLAVRESEDGFARELVVKRILPNLATSPEFQRMFRAEARLASRMSHPHVVHVYDYGSVTEQDEETFYLAMELVRGVDLRALVVRAAEDARRAYRPFAIAPHHAAKIASYVCEALAYAHALVVDGRPAHLVHRDVTPSNVLLSFEGAVKLADFGVAKAATSDVGTRLGVVKGKRRYLSPEQARGEALDARSDLFNVGILLFESILGEALFPVAGGWRPGEVPDRVRIRRMPTPLADITERALSARAADRYPDALSMRADLEGFVRRTGEATGGVELGALLRALFPETLAEDRRGRRAAGTIAAADVPLAAATAKLGTGRAEIEAPPELDGADDGSSSARRLIASQTLVLDLGGVGSRTIATQVRPASVPPTRVQTRAEMGDGAATEVQTPARRSRPGASGIVAYGPLRATLVAAGIVGVAMVGWLAFGRGGHPRTAVLRVVSAPSGASVEVDGRGVGSTPLELPVEPAAHHVTLSLHGYAGESADVGVADPHETVELSFTLRPTSQ